VIAPPSLHQSGNRYQWKPGMDPNQIPLADLPQTWFDRIDSPRKSAPGTRKTAVSSLHSDEEIAAKRSLIGHQNDALPDDELLEWGKTNNEKLASLLDGDLSRYARENGTIDHSRADFALFNSLALLTKCDVVRMIAIFKTTPLWEHAQNKPAAYLERTAHKAIRNLKVGASGNASRAKNKGRSHDSRGEHALILEAVKRLKKRGTMANIRDQLCWSNKSLSPELAVLVDKGYLEKIRLQSKGRVGRPSSIYKLTPKGRDWLKTYKRRLKPIVGNRMPIESYYIEKQQIGPRKARRQPVQSP
jgi:DNA-binding MarR family transcriptional regulator